MVPHHVKLHSSMLCTMVVQYLPGAGVREYIYYFSIFYIFTVPPGPTCSAQRAGHT